MNAISVLEKDHRAVDRLFEQYGRLRGTDERTATRRRELLRKITRELSVHATIEEHELYPKIREVVPDGDDLAEEALNEHQEVKKVLARLENEAGRAGFRADFAKLVHGVRHHIQEEQGELFPRLRQHMSQKDLADLGTRLEHARSTAPTHPHPNAPNKPPANIVGDLAAAVVDRIRDALESVMPSGQAPPSGSPRRSSTRATGSGERRPARVAVRKRARTASATVAKRRRQARKARPAAVAKRRVAAKRSSNRRKRAR